MLSQKEKRNRKRKEKLERKLAHQGRMWEPFACLLAELPLDAKVKQAIEKSREVTLRHLAPRPEFLLDPSAAAHAEAEAVRAEVEASFMAVQVNKGSKVFRAADYLMASIALCCRLSDPVPRNVAPSLWAPSCALTADFCNTHVQPIFGELLATANLTVQDHSAFDNKIWWLAPDIMYARHGMCPESFMLHCANAQQRNVEISGNTRPVYRCASWTYKRGFTWTTWDVSQVSSAAESSKCDVYIQSHALDRLWERIPIAAEFAVQDAMMESLARPVFVEPNRDSWLVEFRLVGERLGYFTALRVGDIVVVRSFLFLTMQGTPEARLLRKKLDVVRPDIEELGWDKLKTFVLSDLQSDPVLLEALNECGCGHLPDAVLRDFLKPEPTVSARFAREYLGL